MKIGIVTYFNIKNYGSALQAFSLKTVVGRDGHDVVFLNVKENKPVYKILHKFHVGFITLLKCMLFKNARKTHKEIRSLKHKSVSNISDETARLFNDFSDRNLPNISIDRISLKKAARTEQFGAFICGSDQIWSPLSVHLSGYKYLDFAPREKRIAYAPSFGVESVPDYNRAFVKKMLLGFDDISVREHQGAEIVNGLINKKPDVVLDPTMLLSGDEWRNLYKEHTSACENGKYALCYFFDEPENNVVQQIAEYCRKNNLKMLVLSRGNACLISNGAEYVEAGPWEFLRYVDGAECVFTNSFHGSVFSILFGRPLKVFGRAHSDAVKQTSRIDTLLETVKLTECMYHSADNSIIPVCTEKSADKLLSRRESSLVYIKNALARRA